MCTFRSRPPLFMVDHVTEHQDYILFIDCWVHTPGLTHLSLGHSLAPSMVLCDSDLSIDDTTFTNWSIVRLLILIDYILKCVFFYYMTIIYALMVLLCYNVNYYNSAWPYYIVIQWNVLVWRSTYCKRITS